MQNHVFVHSGQWKFESFVLRGLKSALFTLFLHVLNYDMPDYDWVSLRVVEKCRKVAKQCHNGVINGVTVVKTVSPVLCFEGRFTRCLTPNTENTELYRITDISDNLTDVLTCIFRVFLTFLTVLP